MYPPVQVILDQFLADNMSKVDAIDRLKEVNPLALAEAILTLSKSSMNLAQAHTELQIKLMELTDTQLPPWAIKKADHTTEIGAQLRTKDGRNSGNAVVFEAVNDMYRLIGDDGMDFLMTESDIEEYFFEPEWISNLENHPGVQSYKAAYKVSGRRVDRENNLPTGRSGGELAVGAALYTRDGRKFGNAIICQYLQEWKGEHLFGVVTEVGSVMKLSSSEIRSGFFPTQYIHDVTKHPGYIAYMAQCNSQLD